MTDNKSKTLLFDIRALQPGSKSAHHGGREHCEATFFNIVEKNCHLDITVYYDPTRPIPARTEDLIEKKHIQCVEAPDSIQLANNLKNRTFDTHFTTMPRPTDRINLINAKYHIGTIFGFRSIEMPTDSIELLYSTTLKNKAKWICKYTMRPAYRHQQIQKWRSFFNHNRFDKIITISEHTKYSLLAFAGDIVESQCVQTLFCPTQIQENMTSVNWEQEKLSPKKYFLILMGNRWTKNAARAIKALDSIYSMNKTIDIKTVLLGCDENDKFYIDVKNRDMFRFKTYVKHGELQCYYANAYAFIYPTLNEGFGYPPLTAMKHKVPVLASCITSVHEVCGNAALYFNPFSVLEIKTRILQIIDDTDLRLQLTTNGTKRVETVNKQQADDFDKLIRIISN